MPYPLCKQFAAQANRQDANRDAGAAQVRGDKEALAAAIFRRCEAQGRLDTEGERAAQAFVAMLREASARRPDHVAELLRQVAGSGDIEQRVGNLEAAVARLIGGVS